MIKFTYGSRGHHETKTTNNSWLGNNFCPKQPPRHAVKSQEMQRMMDLRAGFSEHADNSISRKGIKVGATDQSKISSFGLVGKKNKYSKIHLDFATIKSNFI